MKYDYLIVGSGLFGATFAYKARQSGKTCLVIDKRPHLGGNVYCESVSFPAGEGGGETVINVHKYGAHIFHTSNKLVLPLRYNVQNGFLYKPEYQQMDYERYKDELHSAIYSGMIIHFCNEIKQKSIEKEMDKISKNDKMEKL